MDFDRLLDRIISAAPLGVAIYLAKNHAAERQKMLELLDRDRTAFRDERRELINRVQAPQLIPQGTRPVDRRRSRPAPPPRPRRRAQRSRCRPRRRAGVHARAGERHGTRRRG
jgi:hypothetical protein